MVKVAPSILSADFSKLGEEISKLKEYGADLIHIDIMDGHFVPNITIGPSVVKAIREYSDLEFDVHLMISEPEKYIESFVKSGADLITVHVESENYLEAIKLIKGFGKKSGISLNPATSLGKIEAVLSQVDLILVMSVNPGFPGQAFIEGSLDKIRLLKEMITEKKLNTLIEVDGGITIENAKEIVSAGADILVAGSAIFKSDNRKEAIKNLR